MRVIACPGGVADLADLLAKLASGEAYVNYHHQRWWPLDFGPYLFSI
jgi:hypothetical protein